MAQAGTATVRVVADTKDAEKAIRKLSRVTDGRITWPESFTVASMLAFIGFVIEKVF